MMPLMRQRKNITKIRRFKQTFECWQLATPPTFEGSNLRCITKLR